ncbi:iron complex transport system substrate-binding protein [Paenibacillus taihuensis]|uniref:Iron complex transport system substrate-binding protein n=1 Tax=Paenibacillus taihuensis TaxID=1156355 RepID=A0A3D9SS19_9BACL|nr:ABC transporter substrate-binding protein [Paenibacillus taihuensis]REE94511.1 iron complex transport system substrate-binding protein [Paenibacillus taihuensis]
MKVKQAQAIRSKLLFTLMVMLLVLLTAACGSASNSNANTSGNSSNAAFGNPAQTEQNASTTNAGNTGSNNTNTAADTNAQATVYPLTVKDVTGTELTFQKAPERIVTLLPSETEVVYAIGAGSSVVGVDDFSNYPKEAASVTRIGGMDADIEKIVSLKPELVLASYTMGQAVVDKLRSLGIQVYATDPKTYDAVMDKIKQIGAILDKSSEAEAVAKHMADVREQVASAVKDAPKPNVYLEFSPGWTVGKGEFLDELITLAGGTNIATNQGWYEIDPEAVVKSNPEDIIYASMTLKEGEKNPILTAIETRPGWSTINAIKNKQVFEVDQDPLTRVGPRLAEGLLEVAKKLHPDLIR